MGDTELEVTSLPETGFFLGTSIGRRSFLPAGSEFPFSAGSYRCRRGSG
jgi:hypothetical protein